MTSIGIIGAGTAGLHLGLRLQQHGVPVTLYAERKPEEVRKGRLLNSVAHHGLMRARERILGINHWDSPEFGIPNIAFAVNGPPTFRFRGQLETPSQIIDHRLYQARLTEDFIDRGGDVEFKVVDAAGIERLAERHDLVVVATGRAGLGSLFARIPEHSPHTQPARKLFAGLFHGIQPAEPLGMQFTMVGEPGEIIEGRMVTVHGPVANLLFEAVPGGILEEVCTRKIDEDQRGFEALVLRLLREHAPITYERVDPAEFRLTGPMDWLLGGFTPVVRRGYTRLGSGRLVMAVGDAHVLHDPVAGQGANAAAASAWSLAETIHETLMSGQAFDEDFFQQAEARAWELVRATTYWTNALLLPPPPHVAEVMFAASQDQRIADDVINTMLTPERALATFAGPESCATFLAQHGMAPPGMAVANSATGA